MKNLRAPEMWQIISSKISFANKRVVDLGCGYGDILAYVASQNPSFLLGIEKDENTLEIAKGKSNAQFGQLDLNQLGLIWHIPRADYVFLCSVLCYLDDPERVIKSVMRNAKHLILEMQYADDGPGWAWMSHDEDAHNWLEGFRFNKIEKLGETYIEDRKKSRSIWLVKV